MGAGNPPRGGFHSMAAQSLTADLEVQSRCSVSGGSPPPPVVLTGLGPRMPRFSCGRSSNTWVFPFAMKWPVIDAE
jgi:hypothetical protein